MSRLFLFLFVFAVGLPAYADDPPTEDPSEAPAASEQTLEEQVKADPDNTDLFNKYMMTNLVSLRSTMSSDPDAALATLKKMRGFVGSLKSDAAGAKTLHGRANSAFDFYEQQIELARTSKEELEAKLKENPNDAATIVLYGSKVSQEIGPIARSEPDKAEEVLTAAKDFLASIREKAEEDAAKKALDGISFSRLEDSIEKGKRLAALIGSDSAPLKIEDSVNGDPLTDADLKGKVVLLDFWAVWCGPCVATFPHLIEWHEKYSEKGLVIIGLTNYYGYMWDNEAGRPKKPARGEEPATHEQEQEMLAKFAEMHNLHHRIAIQSDRSLPEFYVVTGIPHVVVIDQDGKVQLMRVGSGEKNAKDVGAKIDELLGGNDAP